MRRVWSGGILRAVAMVGGFALILGAAPNPEAPLAEAAMRRDADAVRALLRRGADVDAPMGDGMTALHWAARNRDAALTEMILRARANPNALTRVGAYTPLHLAARAGDARTAELLLKSGAKPNVHTTTGGATPLHFATLSGSIETVAALLDGGAEIDAREEAFQQTALMWAADANQAEIVELLARRGASTSAMSLIEDIAARTRFDDVDEQDRNERLNRVYNGFTPPPPRDAAEEAPPSDEPRPLTYGDLIGKKGGFTPLHFAARQGNTESVLALLDAGADIDLRSGGDETSPLLIATLNGHFDLALLLLRRGADPNLASDAGTTPLYLATHLPWAPKAAYPQPTAWQQQRTSYLELMEELLEAGADPNARLERHLWYMEYNFPRLGVDTGGATPFWRAAYATDMDAMRLLIRYGADPSIPTRRAVDRRNRGGNQEGADPSGLPPVPVGGPGVYPIHAASGVGYGEGFGANAHRVAPGSWVAAVRYLVEELGADVNARDHNGYNAIHHAASRGDNEVIEYLVSRGGDVTAVSRRDQTTVDMANGPVQRTQPFPETIRLLESLGAKNNNRCVSC